MIYKAILPRLKNKCKRINTICLWSGSCVEAVERAVAETDVGGVLPLGRLHSLLNIINIVMQKLGHLILSYLPKVLQILLCVTASVSTLLDQREQVSQDLYDSHLLLMALH